MCELVPAWVATRMMVASLLDVKGWFAGNGRF
jgi:hypothetical protein